MAVIWSRSSAAMRAMRYWGTGEGGGEGSRLAWPRSAWPVLSSIVDSGWQFSALRLQDTPLLTWILKNGWNLSCNYEILQYRKHTGRRRFADNTKFLRVRGGMNPYEAQLGICEHFRMKPLSIFLHRSVNLRSWSTLPDEFRKMSTLHRAIPIEGNAIG